MKTASIRSLAPVGFLVLVSLALWGCQPLSGDSSEAAHDQGEEEEISPEDKKYLAAAKPFLDAITARDYTNAFALLSKDAKSWMSLNQFVPPLDDQEFARNRAKALTKVTVDQFVAWMRRVEQEHGLPFKVREAHVFSTDPEVLSGKSENLDVMFAIGGIPDTVPVDVRRASVRCQVGTKLTVARAKQIAKDLGMTLEELKQTSDFSPYFNLKLVLVEEPDALRVGYFEFLPPSMLD